MNMTYSMNFGGNGLANHDQDALTSATPTSRLGWQSMMWRKFQNFLKQKKDAQEELDGFSLADQFVISAWAVSNAPERLQNNVRSQFKNASAFFENLDALEVARFAFRLKNGFDPTDVLTLARDMAD